MKNKYKSLIFTGTLCLLDGLCSVNAGAWDYEGHYVINQLALATLPTNFPAFTLTPSARGASPFWPANRIAGGIRPIYNWNRPTRPIITLIWKIWINTV